MRVEPALFRQLCDAISGAYNLGSLRMMLHQINRRLEDYTTDAPFPERVTVLAGAAQDQGWLDDLVRAAIELCPENELLLRLEADYRPVAEAAAADPYDAYVLRAGRPFVNRKGLRAALRALASPDGSRVLVVDGPAESGKTYSVQLLLHVAGHPKKGGFWVHSFDLANPAGRTADQLAYDIVSKMGGERDKMPPQGLVSAERWAEHLTDWVAIEIVRLGKPRYLVFDSFSKAKVDGPTQELITRLAQRAESDLQDYLRVLLLSYAAVLPPDINDYVQRESVTPFGPSDMVELVLAVAAAAGKPPPPLPEVTAAVQKIWDAYPEGTPGRNRQISRQLANLLQIVLKNSYGPAPAPPGGP
jgi:hypothetical protein